MAGINDVRMYHGSMAGLSAALQLMGNSNAGSKIINIFDACLVNGFNLQAVTSLTVSGGLAEVTTTAAHGYLSGTVIRIAGATPSGLNGDWKIDNSTTNTFSFPTAAASGAATGTITALQAPLGWSKPFSATDIAAYRAPEGARKYLQLSDPAQYAARVRGYNIMTSATAGADAFPTSGQVSLALAWSKSGGPSSVGSGDRWYLIGDQRFFYFIFDGQGSFTSRSAHGPLLYLFGEIPSYVSGDVGCTLLSGLESANTDNFSYSSAQVHQYTNTSYLGYSASGNTNTYSQIGTYIETPYTGAMGTPGQVRYAGHHLNDGWGSSRTEGSLPPAYPNPADGALIFHYPVMVQETSRVIRGILPGAYQPLNSTLPVARHGTSELINGRSVLLLKAPDANSVGMMGIDITGPWR